MMLAKEIHRFRPCECVILFLPWKDIHLEMSLLISFFSTTLTLRVEDISSETENMFFFVTIFAVFISLSSTQDISQHETTFVGSTVHCSCKSPFAPIWNWFGKNKVENLAVGAVKHKKFKDDR